MFSSGANVIIWDKMLSCGANVVILLFGANVIIWCYHVVLSSGMITPPILFFLKTSLTPIDASFAFMEYGLAKNHANREPNKLEY
jgi:hypothetical protein